MVPKQEVSEAAKNNRTTAGELQNNDPQEYRTRGFRNQGNHVKTDQRKCFQRDVEDKD